MIRIIFESIYVRLLCLDFRELESYICDPWKLDQELEIGLITIW